MPRPITTLIAALFLFGFAGTALSQGYREAEIEFSRGELLLEMRDYPRAIFAFKKAYSIQPDSRFLAGLVKAYHARGDKEQALVWGELYVERAGETPENRVADIVAKLKREFGADAGRVDITLFPAGGKLVVVTPDGERESAVVSDKLITRWLPLGENVVEFTREGYSTARAKVTVDRGKRVDVHLTLERADGLCELVVDANVRGALVYLDGKEEGKTPFKVKVEAGDHLVQVWSENHLAWSGVIDAPALKGVAVNANLVPATAKVTWMPNPEIRVEERSRFWTLSTGGWFTIGAGVAALGAFTYLIIKTQGLWNQTAGVSDARRDELLAEALPYYYGAMGAAVAGGGMVAGGILMIVLDSGDELEESAPFELLTISPGLGPDCLMLDAMWTF